MMDRFRLEILGEKPVESSQLHDLINIIRRTDPVAYRLEGTEIATTAPGARWFTLVDERYSRYRT